MKDFNFGEASSFSSAIVLKSNFGAIIFQGFCLASKNIFFKEQPSMAEFVSLLKSVCCSLLEAIYWKDVLKKIFGIFSGKQPCSCVINKIKLHNNIFKSHLFV